jgi:hypothetical protein
MITGPTGETHLYLCQKCGTLALPQTDVCGGSSHRTR